MTTTETQAQSKLCPSFEMHIDSTCIGSSCMAWRWSEPKCERIKPEDRKGYCGLAREPKWSE